MASRTGSRRAAPPAVRGTDVQRGGYRYYSDTSGRALTTPQGGKVRQQGGYTGYQSPGGTRVIGRNPDVSLPTKTWHRVVLAEFALCIVLVGASPILTPRTTGSGSTEKVDTTLSLAGPLVRLTAVCVLFFVLALMATGPKSGKVAAAFGGLVVLGALINATDMLTALAKAFVGSAAAGSFSTGDGASQDISGVVNALGGPPPTPSGTQTPPIGDLG